MVEVRPVRAGVVVAVAITLFGVGTLGALVYADLTTAVTRDDFEAYRRGCDELAGQTRLVDGGLGMRETTLNETHVQRCENTTYEEYRQERHQSLRTAPIGLAQWLSYGTVGLLATGGGVTVLRRELAAQR